MNIRIVSWILGHQRERWLDLVSDVAIDVAVLQEACLPPDNLAVSGIVPAPVRDARRTAGTNPNNVSPLSPPRCAPGG